MEEQKIKDFLYTLLSEDEKTFIGKWIDNNRSPVQYGDFKSITPTVEIKVGSYIEM